MHILAISGSLRTESTNAKLLRAAAAMASDDAVTLSTALAALPHFNPDHDTENSVPSPAVAEWRASVADADALLISTPEYAHGVPGSLKNALDWLVSSPAIIDKPAGILNASARATYADTSLRETLRVMSARIIPAASVTIPLDGRRLSTDEMLADPEIVHALRGALDALRDAMRAP
ncbi:MAG TPA: NADPH-dependent FMN reductase [Thermoanaerobaculia bacterium]|nr:NADPH-dependent FMN reductase [Thermoanaerobaculia bacterium]